MSPSGTVTPVLGPVPAAALGVTLPHEHVIRDVAPSMYTPSPDPADRDALAPLGIRHLDVPLSPDKLWAAIQAARGRPGAAVRPAR